MILQTPGAAAQLAELQVIVAQLQRSSVHSDATKAAARLLLEMASNVDTDAGLAAMAAGIRRLEGDIIMPVKLGIGLSYAALAYGLIWVTFIRGARP